MMLFKARAREAAVPSFSHPIALSSHVKNASQAPLSWPQRVRSSAVMSAVCAVSRAAEIASLAASSPSRLYAVGLVA
ncbi:MAG: hypothetical protein AUG44_24145 [Actinobacteria bacterium 13_1_20CM_3_71_11]|nr:MAG: hypothetical protein AUG44_24145 [Actinobacteria bacterium 13_1_20CM_3_71_11]